jgi:DNA repair exonuclease SbcCD ATPase subunit
MMDLQSVAARVLSLKTDLTLARRKVQEGTEEFNQSSVRLQDAYNAQLIIQRVAESVQNAVHSRISTVVTSCLKDVFGDRYEFKIIFDRSRGKTEARLVLVTMEGVEMDPTSSCGGGVTDVASFALRVACLSLSRPRLRPLLVLDEAFRFVSEEYRESVAQVLERLSIELGVRVLQVTHIPELVLGHVVNLRKV